MTTSSGFFGTERYPEQQSGSSVARSDWVNDHYVQTYGDIPYAEHLQARSGGRRVITLMNIDHITPRAVGGDELANLQLLYHLCNQAKGVRTDSEVVAAQLR